MKLFDHWARTEQSAVSSTGSPYWLVGWGGSNISVEDAQQQAAKRIKLMETTLSTRDLQGDSYHYGLDYPLKEIVVERFGNANQPFAAITRNRYGALVLNAANVFIADVDLDLSALSERALPERGPGDSPAPPRPGFFKRLFSSKTNTSTSLSAYEQTQLYQERIAQQRQTAVSTFEKFHSQFPALSFRVYETAAGYRIVVTSQMTAPDNPESEEWMQALNSDELYRKLCRAQQCYRARLTPKPWRLPDCISPVVYPDTQHSRNSYLEDWIKQYQQQSAQYAVCKLVRTFGDSKADVIVEQVLRVHDEYVLGDAALSLA